MLDTFIILKSLNGLGICPLKWDSYINGFHGIRHCCE